jgi:hypothetical protein
MIEGLAEQLTDNSEVSHTCLKRVQFGMQQRTSITCNHRSTDLLRTSSSLGDILCFAMKGRQGGVLPAPACSLTGSCATHHNMEKIQYPGTSLTTPLDHSTMLKGRKVTETPSEDLTCKYQLSPLWCLSSAKIDLLACEKTAITRPRG